VKTKYENMKTIVFKVKTKYENMKTFVFKAKTFPYTPMIQTFKQKTGFKIILKNIHRLLVIKI
jgi:hypothetical protein